MKDFRSYAMALSDRIRDHAKAFAQSHKRPYQHVFSPKASKEEIAQAIIERDKLKEGLVCVLSCVEPCRSFQFVRFGRKKKHCGLKSADRQCLFIYFYFLDRDFGLMHIRLQTWLPFPVQVCINGWEWLARRLKREGISYQKAENCFIHIDDIAKAQRLTDTLIDRQWVPWLQRWARIANPWIPRNPLDLQPYYWTVRECEYSTDVLFKSGASLTAVYPALLDHAIFHFHSNDVLRFLQRHVSRRFKGEVKSSFKVRIEGTRIKHWVEENSIKMYDKQGRVLRVETTINNPRRWRVRRRTTRKGKRCMAWIPMRKSIADLRRRAEVSRAANERYLDALSTIGQSVPAHQVLDPIAKRKILNGRSYRPMQPIAPQDAAVLSAISRGEFALQGFRNADLRPFLFLGCEADDPSAQKRVCGKISRTLRLLRAHGIIYRVSKSNIYHITRRGLTTTAIAARLRNCNALQPAA